MRKKYSPEQVVKLLRGTGAEIAAGKTVEEVCRRMLSRPVMWHTLLIPAGFSRPLLGELPVVS